MSISPASTDPVLARMGELLDTPIASELDVLEIVRHGLTCAMWASLQSQCPLPRDLFVPSDAVRLIVALDRRFSPAQSDLILRAVRLVAQAREALGSLQAARDWLDARQDLLPSCAPVSPWRLASCEAGARLCQSLLGLGTASVAPMALPKPAPAIDVDALVREQAGMSDHDLDWAAALEEQRTAGLPEVASSDAVGADVDVDALMADVAMDPHAADWAAALAEQRNAEHGEEAVVDADDILADVQRQQATWQTGASVDQVVGRAEHQGLVAGR
ncbi:hypothetical protein GCM10008101_18660 [Lysobacter xinjiangensis]|uniref:Uncharacterized protein n=1 Tax=Cognatilysobacter xinjiangensis TaxID=546892 RepID=A0ABQ3C2C5_9GAMM|nr:hypothetical protein [Lysobacter xinjiangensis]GGZ65158.1 hypothetical protein GCM10008101_18660 [Lysobacter xinjiangensis]